MSQLIIDRGLLSILIQARGPTELRDPSGQLVGTFTPATESDDWDFDEADRAAKEERHLCITTTELMARLHALEDR
jgi:hypothetical protein